MMYTPRGRATLWKKPSGFGASHCMKCKAGWTRDGERGSALTVCLLDREPIMAEMTGCDRYEPKTGQTRRRRTGPRAVKDEASAARESP
jgi:hypothetical protein